ncbi:MAG: C39 family peptidase [Clostridium sp.]|uniref:C39 family peptidase n=1 Tax=Clostridium sp. TaxID=1506 RepID=UPI0039952567
MKKIITLTSAVLLGLSFTSCAKNNSNEVSSTSVADNIISYPEGYDTTSQGASSYANSGDHLNSKYFAQLDVYNLKSTDTLTILPKFKTYQQTKEYTCGPATALMVLEHFGEKNYDELQISEMMKCHKDLNNNNTEDPGVANERGEYGTSTDRIVSFFEQIGWNVTSSLNEGTLEGGYTFDDPTLFRDWVITNLKDNTPIMVEWIDWAGHWSNIIGYDTMGTDSFGDDVIILADLYDTSDHMQDGYHIVPAERFFYMWLDKKILPEDQDVQQWLIATPAN